MVMPALVTLVMVVMVFINNTGLQPVPPDFHQLAMDAVESDLLKLNHTTVTPVTVWDTSVLMLLTLMVFALLFHLQPQLLYLLVHLQPLLAQLVSLVTEPELPTLPEAHKVSEASDLLNHTTVTPVTVWDMLVWDMPDTDTLHSVIVALLALLDTQALQLLIPTEAHKVLASKI